MNVNPNHNLMRHMPTHATPGAVGARRLSRRAVYNRAEEGHLSAQPQWRVITQHTTREGRAWRDSEEA